jgi:hypothetical protein
VEKCWTEIDALPVYYAGYLCGAGWVYENIVGVEVGVPEGGGGVCGVFREEEWEDEGVVFED